MKPIKDFFVQINKMPKKITIIFHQKPDGDAFGSALGLAHFLKKFHHHIKIVSPTNWANFLHWMPGREMITDGEKYPNYASKHINDADWIFCLDFNILNRTKNLEPVVKSAKAIKILIDHHQQPQEENFDYGISDVTKSSTAEMIYDLICDSGFKKLIDETIATCLYVGIMTDTGSFRFSNCDGRVHEIIAQLKKTNFNHTIIHQHLFDNNSLDRIKFLGYLLLNRLVIREDIKVAIIYITQDDASMFNILTGDTEGVVQFPLSIKNIELAALIIDRKEEIRLSLRSKNFFDVNAFCRKYFNGGGHIMAAGGRTTTTLEETLKQFWSAIEQEMNPV